MRTRAIAANDVRLPDPLPGEAIEVELYGGRSRKAVVVHPSDFDLFQRLLELFERTPYELRLTDTALAAHRLGESGRDEDELDYASLDRALDA